MILPPNDLKNDTFARHVDLALTIALALKREWLACDENRSRVKNQKLLPVDLGIGIHVGHTFIEEDRTSKHAIRNPRGFRPEGYAINLAKRVEGYSRNGKFTNIFLSEAAHGAWTGVPDERMVIFDEMQVMEPKGISRKIAVFEVKHHFLPTDWADYIDVASKRGRSLVDTRKIDLELLHSAHALNPTNLWLAEEYILQSVVANYSGIKMKDRNRPEFRKKAFSEAKVIAENLANSELRDPGILLIQGFLEGEQFEFGSEREFYDEAAADPRARMAEVHWYKALSYSYQIFYELNRSMKKSWDDLERNQQDLIKLAYKEFEKAKNFDTNSAWLPFDHGCELVRWATSIEDTNAGIDQIEIAHSRLSEDIANEIENEEYLESVRDHPKIRKLIT